jgi:fumarate reductase flavoprotein subunit
LGEFLRNFAPQQAKAIRVGGIGNVGDGMRMAWRLGAALRDMGEVKGTYGAHVSACNNGQEILLIFYRGAIIVNRAGKRFVDESVSYKLIGDACLAQEGAVSWQVFDRKIFAAAKATARLFNPEPALNRGLLIDADSLETLAQKCGIDPASLPDTVSAYNADCSIGQDRIFGRDGLCNHVGALVPIDCPPYFAYPSTTAVLATYCGLAIDASARVIDVYDEPILGLYAAGEVIGGFHGHAYMTGSSLGKSALFGRIAGTRAALHETNRC